MSSAVCTHQPPSKSLASLRLRAWSSVHLSSHKSEREKAQRGRMNQQRLARSQYQHLAIHANASTRKSSLRNRRSQSQRSMSTPHPHVVAPPASALPRLHSGCVFAMAQLPTYTYNVRLLLTCTRPPLCVRALWMTPAWGWRDVRSVFPL